MFITKQMFIAKHFGVRDVLLAVSAVSFPAIQRKQIFDVFTNSPLIRFNAVAIGNNMLPKI